MLFEARQHLLQTRLLQAVLDKTLRPVSGRHRRLRPGDEGQGPRVPRGVFRVLRLRRGPVQGRLLRSAGRRRFLPAGLRAAQAQGHGVRSGADVQPSAGGRPPLAVGAQGPAAEEEERSAALVAHDDGRLQRAHRAQRAQDTAVDIGSHAGHRPIFFDGIADLRNVQLVLPHKLFDDGHDRRHVAAATSANADEAHANVVQTPPAAYNEVVLQHQPKPRCQGLETAGSKDWTVQTSATGLVSKRSSKVEKKHHEAREQPNGDQFHVEPEPDHAVRPRSDQGTHPDLAGFKLCRSLLISHVSRCYVNYSITTLIVTVHSSSITPSVSSSNVLDVFEVIVSDMKTFNPSLHIPFSSKTQ